VSVAPRRAGRLCGLALAAAAAGCGAESAANEIPIGLLLSYTGYVAANSVNSERALRMAVDSVNAAGGVGGRPLRVTARDTRSSSSKIAQSARELLEAQVAVLIGPDAVDLVSQLRPLLLDRTIILPSFNTTSDVLYKPSGWFVMGASLDRAACELVAQLRADHRQRPVVVANPQGYNSGLAWHIANRYGIPKYVLPTEEVSTNETVQPLVSTAADAYVLAVIPPSASSLVFAMAAQGELADPTRWYLSPSLHNPTFLDLIPKGSLDGARGVSQGTVAGTADFRARFAARWQDQPLDDAYPFYDAAALAALALQRALTLEGEIPSGTGLGKHILAVTHGGGTAVRWNELEQGLELIRRGQPVQYLGISGSIEFDASGQAPEAAMNWWTVRDGTLVDVPHQSECPGN
jgi:neutral amino acid transport system substrate-binding protein